MICRILTPLDPSKYTETAIRYACEIAKRQHAEITGMVALNIPEIEKSVGPVPVGALYWADKLGHSRVETTKRHIGELLKKFAKTCEKEGVNHLEAEFQGSPSKHIMTESIFYDLVVMGIKTFYYYKKSEDPGVSLEEILSHSVTPIFAVPETFRMIERVVIAFDGSLPAARALQRFSQLAFLHDMEVTIVLSGNNKEMAGYYLNNAEKYLHTHGIGNVRKEWTRTPIVKAMQDEYLKNADLVVTGIHSKSVVKDFFVGSLTRCLIERAEIPVFIGQ